VKKYASIATRRRRRKAASLERFAAAAEVRKDLKHWQA